MKNYLKKSKLSITSKLGVYSKFYNDIYFDKANGMQESDHVYLKTNNLEMKFKNTDMFTIAELGFGTGLNTLLTASHNLKVKKKVYYHGIEAYPVNKRELDLLNYDNIIKSEASIFRLIHDCLWNKTHEILPNFFLKKKLDFFSNVNEINMFNVIYFDAFGPRVQPNLWTEFIFKKMYDSLRLNGILVTYSAKGSVRRNLQSVGFLVERLPGPPGKREMLRATKVL